MGTCVDVPLLVSQERRRRAPAFMAPPAAGESKCYHIPRSLLLRLSEPIRETLSRTLYAPPVGSDVSIKLILESLLPCEGESPAEGFPKDVTDFVLCRAALAVAEGDDSPTLFWVTKDLILEAKLSLRELSRAASFQSEREMLVELMPDVLSVVKGDHGGFDRLNQLMPIVLDRLNQLKSSHREIMVDLIMDVLRALSSPNLDITRKTLDIALELITSRNVDEVVILLKEVVKTQSTELEKNGEYRQMLVQAIHSCAIKFPVVASTVVHSLMILLTSII